MFVSDEMDRRFAKLLRKIKAVRFMVIVTISKYDLKALILKLSYVNGHGLQRKEVKNLKQMKSSI